MDRLGGRPPPHQARPVTPPDDPATLPDTREGLMLLHAAARGRRDTSALGSEEFRAAAEEVARIEGAIAAIEEPPATPPADVAETTPGGATRSQEPAARPSAPPRRT